MSPRISPFSFVAPGAQLSALAQAVRDPLAPPRFVELDELARRKLGRLAGFGHEGSLVALIEVLDPEEPVIDLAIWSGGPGGLLALCVTRLVALPSHGTGILASRIGARLDRPAG